MGDGKDIAKKSMAWNMVFSILSAMQSVVMAMAAARLAGATAAGMVSIAFAAGYLMWMIVAFGVRNFHATDTGGTFAFGDYAVVRIITGIVALLLSGIYCICQGYTGEKLSCVLLICLLKVAEAFEDLYHGELQRTGRLDIACKLGSARLAVNYATFFLMMLLGHGFLAAVSVTVAEAILAVLLEIFLLSGNGYVRHADGSLAGSRQIFRECFPLFLIGFLNIYICNAPKYAIDSSLAEEAQAYFSALYAPVFSIGLLSAAIYNPQMVSLSRLWNGGKKAEFFAVARRQAAAIFAITVCAMVCGIAIGVKVLGVLYGLPLGRYVLAFVILLAGGGLAAFYNFLLLCLTVMRGQAHMAMIPVIVAIEALAVSRKMVMRGGIMGAAALYLLLMASELLVAVVAIYKYLRKK